MMRSSGKLNASKALVVNDAKVSSLLRSENNAESEAIFESVSEELSNVVDVFVQDGALGSHGSCETRVRVVTDSPDLALAMKHLLVRVPLKDDAREQGNRVTLFVSTGISAPDSKSANLAVRGGDEEGSIDIAVAGSPSISSVLDLLGDAVRENLKDHDALPVRCASYLTQKGEVALIFSDDASSAVDSAIGKSLEGGHGHIWSQDGVAKFYGGAIVSGDDSKDRGSVVLSSSKATVRSLTSSGNLLSHPSSVIFMSSKAKKGSMSDMGTVKKYFEAAGHSADDANVFESMLQKHNVKVFGARTPSDTKDML
jgi:ATP-dependent phosphoenolpyruvate carboxykinase